MPRDRKVAAAVGSAVIAIFSFMFTLLRVAGANTAVFWSLSFLSPVAMSSAGSQIWHGDEPPAESPVQQSSRIRGRLRQQEEESNC